jgi:hypothetical protein
MGRRDSRRAVWPSVFGPIHEGAWYHRGRSFVFSPHRPDVPRPVHPRRPFVRSWLLLLALFSFVAPAVPGAARADRLPDLDRSASVEAAPATRAAFERARADAATARGVRVGQIESRYALPTFLWAAGGAPDARRAAGPGQAAAAEAARAHLDRVAPLYRLDATDVREATLRRVHDTGRGGVIATFSRSIQGIEVFRDAMNVLMDREGRLVAVSGFLPGRSLLGAGRAREFRLSAAEATALAVGDFTGLAVAAASVRATSGGRGGFEAFDLAAPVPGFLPGQPLRARPVWFHLPESLVPAWHVEVIGQEQAYAYVISAADGEVLFRRDLLVSDSFGYRVWADAAHPYIPWDGPQGTAPSPHPTGVPDLYGPAFVAPVLVTLQNGPISTSDPWLPPGAVETAGNNVDAYCDLSAPDGLTAGDFRAPLSGPGLFDHTYDMNLPPSSTAQRNAAITQLFFTNNFLHDWYYDSGFDEASGNAQVSNSGRGGVEGDALRAEAQDYSGTNNANMMTPSDGAQPRMQMYVWNRPAGTLTVTAPAPIAGTYQAGYATFGPQTFAVSGDVVTAVDGVGTPGDGCSALVNAVAGKIVLVDRSTCGFVTPVLNAQAAGAIGAIIVDNFDYGNPIAVSGSGSVTIPVLTVTLDVGDAIKAQLGGTVSVGMSRSTPLLRDGTIDNQIVAHEWGHYISNRLVGGGAGISGQQGGGMGEGWSDFHALLLTARAGDDFDGAYPIGPHALAHSAAPTNVYYYGIRRYPYTTDMTKDPLTFRHIQQGVALPVGPPVAFGADGSVNAAVHRTGEVWCTMLWECYAALLKDTGRLTFAEAQQRMRDYLVAAYKLTPAIPTITEARDALLAAAAAHDPADLAALWNAFAKRGCGTGAVSPDRYATDNVGVVESYSVGNDLVVSDVSFAPTFQCDGDGYVDDGEYGELSFTFHNIGAVSLTATQATLVSTNPAVTFPNGNVVTLPATTPFAEASATVPVRLVGPAATSVLDLEIQVDDPGLLVAGPRTASTYAYAHADEEPSATHEFFETTTDVWTYTGDSGPAAGWTRRTYSGTDRRLFAYDPGVTTDASAVTPPLTIGGLAPFRLHFEHAYSLENTYDGGVIEISTDGGATWTDIGASITTGGYTGTIVPGSALAGRSAWTGTSPGYPALTPVTVDLGTSYAGQTVRVRFRVATDGGVGDAGWSIPWLVVEDNHVQVFRRLIGETAPCTPLAADDPGRPAEMSFALAGAHPASGPARLRFALPAASRVEIDVYDVTGRRVARIVDGEYAAGAHTVTWNPSAGGVRSAAGLYFARMTAGGRRLDQRVVLMP